MFADDAIKPANVICFRLPVQAIDEMWMRGSRERNDE